MADQGSIAVSGNGLVRVTPAESWLDKRELARHFSCSVRSIETAQAEGMPHAIIFGRVKFQVSTAEPWLEEHGYFRRVGGIA